MALYGPLKTSECRKKFKFAELIAIPDKRAETVAAALFSRWLCRHGLPLEIMLDQGKEFCNEVVDKLLVLLKAEKTTTPYQPETDAK
jgi:hypothetical protein